MEKTNRKGLVGRAARLALAAALALSTCLPQAAASFTRRGTSCR